MAPARSPVTAPRPGFRWFRRVDRQAVALGSVKSMIGHTKATAGVAGPSRRRSPSTTGCCADDRRDEAQPARRLRGVPSSTPRRGHGRAASTTTAPRRERLRFRGTDFHIVLEYGRDREPQAHARPARRSLPLPRRLGPMPDAARALAAAGGAEPALADSRTRSRPRRRRQAPRRSRRRRLARAREADAPALIGSRQGALPDASTSRSARSPRTARSRSLPGPGSQHVTAGSRARGRLPRGS